LRNRSAVLLLIAGASLSYDNKTGGSVFTLLGQGGPGDYDYSLKFYNSQENIISFDHSVTILAGATIRDGTLGTIIYERLSEDKDVTAEYDIKKEH